MKTILILLVLLSIVNAQSDSLKLQAVNACNSAVMTGATVVVATVSACNTVVESGKTVVIASKEVYNSDKVQSTITKSKEMSLKLFNIVKTKIDSVRK